MLKNVVVTLAIGENARQLLEVSEPLMRKYAEKIKADFYVIDTKKLSTKFVHYEKFQIYDLFKDYKRILYLDCDILVREDCPNLFELVQEYELGIFNEGRFCDLMEVVRDACMKFKISLKKWEQQSYNTGVMVLSRLHKNIFKNKPEEEFDVYAGNITHYEQPYLNLKIISEEYKVKELQYFYNRLSIFDALTGEHRLSSYIVHYAGVPEEVRFNLMKEDIKSWEESKPKYFYPKNIYVAIGGGLGDQIDSEPVIRYMRNKMYPKDNILISTDFKDVFRHLDVRILPNSKEELRKEPGIWYKMETFPSPESKLWQFLAQSLCHTTDYASIATLRRTLPDQEKQIHLKIDLEDINSLMQTTKLTNLQNFVLVHPGKGWSSKTFPKEYWESIVNGLVEQNLPVALIGKYVSKEQGLVEIDCPEEVLDLRNLLTFKELCALISQAKVLVSNDSAPIHIAGAFDNWIVLLPSCKHPDHVLPYRNGTKDYKTISLYKKLTCDAIDSSPTQIEGQTIDYIVGKIEDYLAEPNTIIEFVKKVYNE